MKVLNILPYSLQKISSGILDLELIRLLSESEAYAWWQDYRHRFQSKIEDSYDSDDSYLASIKQQAG